ncbi:MAG: choice-of-anchor P family protein [Dokdonella sp.]
MSSTTRFSFARRMLAWLVVGTICSAGTPAFAQVAGGNAYDIQAHISVAGLINLDISPIKQVQISPQADPFALQDQLQDWSNSNAAGSVSAGTLDSALQWVPGVSEIIVGAEATATNVAVSAVSLLGSALIEISADQVHSLTMIAGQCPSGPNGAHPSHAHGPQPNDLSDVINDLLYGNGFDTRNLLPVNNVDLPGLQVSILGIAVPNLPLNPPPNTGINLQALGIVGATLMLNEQTTGGDGVNSMTMSTNALHLNIDVAGLITADVTLGHADISLLCNG